MRKQCKQLLSILLVLVMALGLIAPVYASVSDDPVPTTEPAETGAADTDLSADELRWAALRTELPSPVQGYSPLDPDNPYPYGEPVDNFYPGSFFEEDPYAVSPMADMNAIPDEMYDNMILRALEYTGYDVSWLKRNGYLYVSGYIASGLKNNAPHVLSDIGYYQSGACPNGDETVADPNTVTGRAPNIGYFEDQGLVCASFVSYYLCNYLPNIEGVDTDTIYDKVKEVGADDRYDDVYYLTTVSTWKTALDSLASRTGSGVTKYTSASTAYANLVPGDVIVFASEGSLVHIAIYAGTYNLYNTSCSNLGKYHFIVHVGNSRGPEISTVEYMSSSGTKTSEPIAWYHLEVNDAVDQTGFIEVYKKDPAGQNLSGAKFKAVHQETGDSYYIGPTNASGYAKSGELSLGTYVVTETVFPTGYEASGTTSWTVTLTKDTPNNTITINAVNKKITGSLVIQKATNTGQNLAGWTFGVYTDAACTKPISGSPFTTPASGRITVTGLEPGTYYVKESSQGIDYWVTDNGVKTVKVNGNETASVTVTNTHYGRGRIVKQTNTGENLSGWKFHIFTNADLTQTVEGSPFTTDDQGVIVRDLLPGTYYVQEVDESGSRPDWTFDTAVKKLTVTAGSTAAVTFTNTQHGWAQIRKTTNTGENLSGWMFNIFTYLDLTMTVEGSPFTTDDEGLIVKALPPGTYYIQEVDQSRTHPDWVFDSTVYTVTVSAGQTAAVEVQNQQLGRLKLIKSMPDGGSLSGWVFDLYRKEDNAHVGTFTSGEDGTILTDYLAPGEYLVREQLDENALYWCETENPQTVVIEAGKTAEVTFVNRLKSGKISIMKVDITGEPLAGAEFLLEWSADGTVWQPVRRIEPGTVGEGSCTSDGLTDGRLVSGESGLVEFTGLHPNCLYRLTETAAPEGFQLLTEAAYEGTLPTDGDLTVELTVVNVRLFRLPDTGSQTLAMMPMALALVYVISAGLICRAKGRLR